jgi:uncharacterized protein involved in outer membrane biogenesis
VRWRRIALWLPLGLIACLLLAATWLFTADLGVLKTQIERIVTEKTGRQLKIDGALHIELGGYSTFIAENARLQNAAWAVEPDMVQIGRVAVSFDFWSLVSGPIVVHQVEIHDAQVRLQHPAGQEPNWELPIESEPETGESGGTVEVLIKEVLIYQSQVIFDSHERNRALDLRLTTFHQLRRQDGMLDTLLDADLGGRIVKVEGHIGTWDALLAGKDIQFEIEAVLDTFKLVASGEVDDLQNPRWPRFEFTATGPNIDDLTRLLGIGEEGSGDINLRGTMAQASDKNLRIGIDGNIGQTTIDSDIRVSDIQSFADLNIDVTASGPELGRLLRIVGINQIQDAPFELRIDAKTSGSEFTINQANMVFGKAQIDLKGSMPKFPGIDDAELSLQIEGPDIARFRYVTGMRGAATGAFSIAFNVDTDTSGAEVLWVKTETELGKFEGTATLGQPPEYFASPFQFAMQVDSLSRIAKAYEIPDLPDYPFTISGQAAYESDGIRTSGPIRATVGNVSVSLDGLVKPTPGVIGTDVNFMVEGPNLAEFIEAFVEAKGIPADTFGVAGRLRVGTGGYNFQEVRGDVGVAKVGFDGLLAPNPGLAGTGLKFFIEGPDYQELVSAFSDLQVSEGWYRLSGDVEIESKAVRLDRLSLVRDNGEATLNLELALPLSEQRSKFDFRLRSVDIRSMLTGLGPVEFNELPIDVRFRGETDGDKLNFRNSNIRLGEAHVETSGSIQLGGVGSNSKLSLSGEIPNLAALGTVGGRTPNVQSLSWSANLESDGTAINVGDLVVKLGDSDVFGKIHFQTGEIPEIAIDVQSDSIVLAPLFRSSEAEYDPEPVFEDGRFIPVVEMPFDDMRKLNASINIDIKALQRESLFLRDIQISATLRDGAFEISQASLAARSGRMRAQARLDPAGGEGAASLQIVARQFALGMVEINDDLSMIGDIDVSLDSTGTDLRALLANLSGALFINTRGGRATNNRFLNALYGDLLAEVLDAVNPFRKTDPYTQFNCVVIPIEIDDGQLMSAPNSFVSTGRMFLVSKSSIDLDTESLQVSVKTVPQRTLSVSAGELLNPYLVIRGTLAAPVLAVDETGLLISGGAALATGGLTILARGVWDRMSRSSDPCKKASDRALELIGGRFTDFVIDDLGRIE